MNAAIAEGRIPDIRKEVHEAKSRQLQGWYGLGGWILKLECDAEIQKKARETTNHLMEDWFKICDRILDIHRSNFLFREPTAHDLEEHKIAVGECVETCRTMAGQLEDDPSPEIRDLASRLEIRIRLLTDAYTLFHDPKFSGEEAERLLNEIFP